MCKRMKNIGSVVIIIIIIIIDIIINIIIASTMVNLLASLVIECSLLWWTLPVGKHHVQVLHCMLANLGSGIFHEKGLNLQLYDSQS